MSNTPPPLFSEDLTSRVIDFVRFPLIVLVVTIHVHLGEFVSNGELQNFPVATFFYDLTGHGISRVAVPLFFFISGYLFFLNASHTSIVGGVNQRALHSPGRGAEPARQEQAQGREHGSFPCSLYFKKLKRRFWLLFVPMAIWGVAFFLARFFAEKFGIDLFPHQGAFDDCSALVFAKHILVRGVLATGLVPFWFLRGLIAACLLSPLWFFSLKKLKFFPLILFGIWYCFFSAPHGHQLVYGLGAATVFFFCCGAYFSIHGIDFTKVFRKIRIPFFIAYPILLVGNAVLNLLGYAELYDKMKNFEAIIGLVATIALVAGFLEKRPDTLFPKTLFSATFFVYAGHFFFVCLPEKLLFPSLFPCETNLGLIVAFLGTTIFAVTCCVLLSVLVRKFAPWSIRFLTGGR